MEKLSLKDIKVGKSYKISVIIGIDNFYFKGIKEYYVNVEFVNKIEDRYLITGEYFLKDIGGDTKSYYGDEFFVECNQIIVQEVIYDVIREQEQIEKIKKECNEKELNIFGIINELENQNRSLRKILMIHSIVMAGIILYMLVS